MQLLAAQDLIYKQIGREVAKRRISVGLSQADLARSIGLTRSSISNIEKGRQKMLVHTLVEIAASLGVPTPSLLPHDDTQIVASGDPQFSGSALSEDEQFQISAIIHRIKSPK